FMMRLPRAHTAFPYTTLFRSDVVRNSRLAGITADAEVYASNRWKVRLLSEFTGVDDKDVLYSSVKKDTAMGQLRLLQAHAFNNRSEEHTSELQSRENLVCRLL